VRPVLQRLEEGGAGLDLLAPLALVAGQTVPLGPDELHGARRRALLLLAAGGDPQLGLELDGRAVNALADELRSDERQQALSDALEALIDEAGELPLVSAALQRLDQDADLAWRAFSCALLAEELAGES
jgi:hypothetical protein